MLSIRQFSANPAASSASIFIDNLYKLSQDSDPKETENFLDWCSVFSAENSVAFTLTIAGEAKDAPEYIARYMD